MQGKLTMLNCYLKINFFVCNITDIELQKLLNKSNFLKYQWLIDKKMKK